MAKYSIDNFIPKDGNYFDFAAFSFAAFSKYMTHFVEVLVSSSDEGYPDVIAYNEYGFEELWWVILIANKLQYFTDLKAGMIIKVPTQADVDEFINSLDVETGGKITTVIL